MRTSQAKSRWRLWQTASVAEDGKKVPVKWSELSEDEQVSMRRMFWMGMEIGERREQIVWSRLPAEDRKLIIRYSYGRLSREEKRALGTRGHSYGMGAMAHSLKTRKHL